MTGVPKPHCPWHVSVARMSAPSRLCGGGSVPELAAVKPVPGWEMVFWSLAERTARSSPDVLPQGGGQAARARACVGYGSAAGRLLLHGQVRSEGHRPPGSTARAKPPAQKVSRTRPRLGRGCRGPWWVT